MNVDRRGGSELVPAGRRKSLRRTGVASRRLPVSRMHGRWSAGRERGEWRRGRRGFGAGRRRRAWRLRVRGVVGVVARAKDQVSVIVGTSAGALISAYLAANWHRPVDEAFDDGLSFWRALRFGDVFAPLMAPGGAARFIRYVGEFLPVSSLHGPSILNPEPLAPTLARLVDWSTSTSLRRRRFPLPGAPSRRPLSVKVVWRENRGCGHRPAGSLRQAGVSSKPGNAWIRRRSRERKPTTTDL
jgi:Patatin-like phospholipase